MDNTVVPQFAGMEEGGEIGFRTPTDTKICE